MGKISSYSAITQPQSNDLLITVDVNDTSMAPTGTDKKMTLGQLYGSTAPWQFTPEAYGAVGNGKVVGDVVTNGTTTITSATAAFTSGDAGKTVMINGANGTAAAPLITTIATYTNSTTVVLTSGAGTSANGCSMVWGTDDTSAIQSAINAATAYALANDYYAEVLFAAKIYMLTAAPTQATSPFLQNAQLQIVPAGIAVNGQARKVILGLKGAGNAGSNGYWEAVIPELQGTCLVSTQTAPSSPSGTYGEQSVVGGPAGGGAFTGSFANFGAFVDGITVWHPMYTNMYCWDFGFISGVEWGSFGTQAFAPSANLAGATAAHPYQSDMPATSSTIGVGCRFPQVGNNDDVCGTSFTAKGIDLPLDFADHFTALRVLSVSCDVAGRLDLTHGASGDSHAVFIGNWSIENYNGGLTCNGGGSGFASVYINMDTETISGSASPVYDVQDAGGCLHGIVRITDANGRTARVPVISGAGNLEVVNDMIGPGYWSGAPAVPATTTPQQNTAFRDATIFLTSGGAAVTVIAVDGQTTGLTLGSSGSVMVRVPSGKNITLTYASTAPTWIWVLD